MRSVAITSLLLISLSFSVMIAMNLPTAHAQGGGPSPGPCPFGAACLSIVPQEQTITAPGGTVTLKVNFTNLASFNAWDIAVKTNNTILNPKSITNVETFGGTFSALANCINNSGPGCSSVDGPGVAHFAGFSQGGSDAGNGTLFTITYTVVAGPVTNVTYVNSSTEKSSVSAPDGSSLVDCSLTPNQCITGSVSVADFSVSTSPTTIGPVGIGTQGSSTITVAPENGFTGTVSLTVSAPAGVTANLATPSVTITSGSQTDQLTASAASGGTFAINVTGTVSGFPSRTVKVTLKVTDYSVAANPPSVSFVRGLNGLANITVTPVNGFTGTVSLVASAPPGVTATLANPSVTITSGNQNDTLTVSSLNVGTYLVNVTGSSPGFPDHKATLTVTVTKQPSTTGTTVVSDGTGTVTGASFHDTAVITGASSTPTGTLTYSFFRNGGCTGTAAFTFTVSAGAVVPNSNSTGSLAAGSYGFEARYNGDSIYSPSTSSCESISVGKAASTIATSVVLKSGTVLPTLVSAGSRVNDTSTVSGITGFDPTGFVVYYFFKNGACTSPFFSKQNVTMSGGIVPNTGESSALVAGMYSFNATYGGDSNYVGSKSSCEPFTVSDFSITATPSSIGTISSGAPGTSILTIASVNGFTGTVNLVIVPSTGLTGSLNVSMVILTSTVTSKNVLLTVSATLGADYSALVNGTSTGFPFHTVLVTVTVSKPSVTASALSVSTASATVGDKVTTTFTLTDNSAGAPFTTTVWLKWGNLTVAQQNVTLTPGQTTQVSMVWDTSGYTSGTDAMSVTVPASGTVASGPSVALASTGSSSLTSNPYLIVLIVVIAAVAIGAFLLLRRSRMGRKTSAGKTS